MSILDAILLGIVQGVTSFLPVSSSGHVVIFEQLLKLNIQDTAFFTAMLNIGTLVALLLVFEKDVRHLIRAGYAVSKDCKTNIKIFVANIIRNQDEAYIKAFNDNHKKFLGLILVSILPSVLVGWILRKSFHGQTSLISVGLCLFITAMLLLVVDYVKPGIKQPKDASLLTGVICGLCQGAAVIPGISRCGLTLSAGILCGFNKKFAVKFSFLMSIPAIIGSLVYEICHVISNPQMELKFIVCCIVGAVVSSIVGLCCIRIMLKLIQKKRLKFFSIYCFILGSIAILGNFLL